MSDPTVGVFGSNNARSTSPEEVAAGFIAPPQFWNILHRGNSLLRGPRGSGKTTLLKMLTVPALEAWDDPRAEEACAEADYSGVFVPADRSWAGQVDAVGEGFDDQLRVRVAKAAFVLHCLHAMVLCARWRREARDSSLRSHLHVDLGGDVEEQIARAVHELWGLPGPAGSLYGLQIGVRDEITALGKLAQAGLDDQRSERALRQHPALSMDLIDVALPFIERFNHAAGAEDHVWAFLVDEIEFLPQGIQAMLVEAVRGRDPRVIQKVSIAPHTLTSMVQLNTPLGGWEGHDLQSVDLTFSEKEQGYPFSRSLVAREISSSPHGPKRGRKVGVTKLLGGEGFFERPPGEDAYGAGSANAKAIEKLAGFDQSFAAWLEKRHIDPSRPWLVTGKRRSETLQKAIAVILLRCEFLHLVRGRLSPRTRKSDQVYVGEKAIFAICENNPRLLKAVVGKLLALQHGGKLRKGTRADVVQACCNEYRLHLRAIEVERSVEDALLPRRLIDTIGDSFAAGVYGEQFDAEPALSFEVSVEAKERVGLASVLQQLTHYGAIIPVGEDGYRLAHMFAPVYKLPLRKGRARSLASMLAPPAAPEPEPEPMPTQLELGEEAS
jgi:hypothetical protein